MTAIYKNIRASIKRQDRLFAVLIDPDKTSVNKIPVFIDKINRSIATHIFVGGSVVDDNKTDVLIEEIKKASVCVVPLIDKKLFRVAIPSKIFEIVDIKIKFKN